MSDNFQLEQTANQNSVMIGSSQISSLSNEELIDLVRWLLVMEEPVDKQSMSMLIEELGKRLDGKDEYEKGYEEGYEEGYDEGYDEGYEKGFREYQEL